jgi:hypothetical protein
MILDDERTHSGGKERDKHTRQSQRERGEKSSSIPACSRLISLSEKSVMANVCTQPYLYFASSVGWHAVFTIRNPERARSAVAAAAAVAIPITAEACETTSS